MTSTSHSQGNAVVLGISEKLIDDENISDTPFYIDRWFKRKIGENENTHDGMSNQALSEGEIMNVKEKVVLISDISGSGKSTVLTNLVIKKKERNPDVLVIKIKLNCCTDTFDEFIECQGNVLTVARLLDNGGTHQLENDIFSVSKKIVLMLDGLDELNPDHRNLIVNMITKCEGSSIAKIFITTEPHLTELLEINLKAKTFMLLPLEKKDQVEYLKSCFMHNLQLKNDQAKKCERYAETLRNRMFLWAKGNSYHHFIGIPLQLQMLAEIFRDSSRWESPTEWQGCKEYLNSDDEEPKLPKNMNTIKLYEMFINWKLQIFKVIENSTENLHSSEEKFNSCLSYYQCLALESIFGETKSTLFSNYEKISDDCAESILKLRIVQKFNNKLHFVHRTFADYFVSKNLLSELRLKKRHEYFDIFFLEEVLTDRRFAFVRELLDNHLKNLDTSSRRKIFKNCSILKNKRHRTEKDKFRFIHVLAEEGCTEILRTICKHISFNIINFEDEKNKTPLYYAVKHDHLETAQLLVKNGANVNAPHDKYSSPLFAAVAYGDIRMFQFLMDNRTDYKSGTCCFVTCIRKTDKFTKDFTVAYEAAYRGQEDMLKDMANRQLDIDGRTESGESLIFGATRGGQLHIIKYLKDLCVEINAKDNHGNTALHIASMDPSFVSTLKLLIESGIDVNWQNSTGNTALHTAAQCGILGAVKLLVEGNEGVNIKDEDGCTPAHVAASWKNFDVFMFLVERGANIHVVDKTGHTPLHLFASGGYRDMVQFVLEQKVDVNKADNSGRTALHEAAWGGHYDIVALLLDHSTDVNAKDSYDRTSLHLAASEGHLDIIQLLAPQVEDVNVADKGQWTVLHYAASKGHVDIVKFLADQGTDVNFKDNEGRTALHSAAEGGHLKTVKFLVERVLDLNVRSAIGYTALHEAASGLHWNVVEFLVKHGADVNIENTHRRTPLHYAALQGQMDTVRLLVEHNANVDCKDNEGRTALHEAAANDHFEIVKFLVEQRVKVDIKDKIGHVAQQVAACKGYSDIVQFLNYSAPAVQHTTLKRKLRLLFRKH